MARAKKAAKTTNLAVVNFDTGEIVKDLNEGDKIFSGASIEAYKEIKKKQKERAMDTKNRGLFVRAVHNKDREIEKELTLTQCDALLNLFFCVTLNSKNYLVHTEDGEKKGQKMNATDISLYLGKSESQTKRDLKALVELGALKSEKNPKKKTENFYFLNDDFFTTTKTKGPKVNFTKMFHNKLKEVRSQLNKNQERGALLKFIRNFHYQTYYLVANPNHNIILKPELSIADNLLLDENEFVLKHLNQKQLAEIIGINENDVKKYVGAFQKAGALILIKQHKNYRFIIHPDLMFRRDSDGEDEYTKFIRSQFKQLESKGKKTTKKRK